MDHLCWKLSEEHEGCKAHLQRKCSRDQWRKERMGEELSKAQSCH